MILENKVFQKFTYAAKIKVTVPTIQSVMLAEEILYI